MTVLFVCFVLFFSLPLVCSAFHADRPLTVVMFVSHPDTALCRNVGRCSKLWLHLFVLNHVMYSWKSGYWWNCSTEHKTQFNPFLDRIHLVLFVLSLKTLPFGWQSGHLTLTTTQNLCNKVTKNHNYTLALTHNNILPAHTYIHGEWC